LNGTFNATAWVFELLIFAGALTVEAFLNPSYYADLPSFQYSSSKKLPALPKKKRFKELTIRHSLWRLRKHGFVEKKGNNFAITQKGKVLANYILKIKSSTEKKWDGKYRVAIFDIPEKEKYFRNWFRQELYLLNYKKLQKSVFVSKCPLTKDIVKEIKRRKMGNYVNYLLVDKIYKNII
jgi:phenylacetic acid degradation operon negative regulatory protein